MARIRTIKPEFWEDESVGELSLGARLLFIATWNLADDEGLLRWTPAYLKAAVFMYDQTSERTIRALMDELETAEMVFPYRGGKTQQELAFIIRFRQHQRINRPQPGKLPPPSIQNQKVRAMYAARDRYTCGICGNRITDDWGDVGPSLDHIVARSKGGSDYPSNLQISHLSCNKGKCARDRDYQPGASLNHTLSQLGNDSVNGAVSKPLADSPPEWEGEVDLEGNGKEGEGESHAHEVATLDGFTPTAEHRALATELGLRIDALVTDWRLQRKATGTTPADLDADFERWIRREPAFANGNGASSRPEPEHTLARLPPVPWTPPEDPELTAEQRAEVARLARETAAALKPAPKETDPDVVEANRAEQKRKLKALQGAKP